MSRIALAKIRSLTFIAGEETKARRVAPIPQLSCVGSACKYYQPEVIRCFNAGGEGIDVDWKCEADLPEKLRFGRVEVSCEGWDHAGDPFVLKGSCGLEYRLVRVHDIDGDPTWVRSRLARAFDRDNIASTAFMLLWGAFLMFMLYMMIRSCLLGSSGRSGANNPLPRPPGSPFYRGWFSGWHPHHDAPPPPYDESWKTSSRPSSDGWSAFRPGFWSGLGLGGLGGTLAGRLFQGRRNEEAAFRAPPPRTAAYDWEYDRIARASSWSSYWSPRQPPRARFRSDDDRGEGPSNLGPMRRSTGYGVSNVR